MPNKFVETPYPLIDADPHFLRVMRYMRPSDYVVWAGATGAFPTALYFWGMLHEYIDERITDVALKKWLNPRNRR